MKKRIMTGAAILAACAFAMAGMVDREILTVTATGTNAATTVTDTSTKVRGYIEQIDIVQVTAATTGTLAVAIVPELSSYMSDVTLVASTNANGDLTYRPRVDTTDTSGTALTSDPPTRYLLCGDSIKFTGSSFTTTNISFKAVIKWQKE